MLRMIKSAGLVVVAGAALVGGATTASADADAKGYASHSPGVLSGNVIQIPVHAPINVCGNTVNVVGALNPTVGNKCVNGDGHGRKHDDHHYGDYDG